MDRFWSESVKVRMEPAEVCVFYSKGRSGKKLTSI